MTECVSVSGGGGCHDTAGIGISYFLLLSGVDVRRVCLFLAYCIGHGP